MKITAITAQAKNQNRVNIHVDGVYRFSLDIFQIGELNLRVGNEYTEAELQAIENESQFGKLYARTLEYCFSRPHSAREIKDYLWRKTRMTKYRTKDGQVKERAGVTESNATRVFQRLVDKGYIDDERFAKFWVESRHATKGVSSRKLVFELRSKGIEQSIIDAVMHNSSRSDETELDKVLAKKRHKYTDEHKLIAYLARQGFAYDDIRRALNTEG